LRVATADGIESELLSLAPGMPLLEVRRVAYSYHQTPVEVRISHVNTARYEYVGASMSHEEPL
jgi:GntR family transcriptional regulator